MTSPIVILAGARTPIGKLSGSLSSFSATALGGFAITAALERGGLTGDQVDYTYMGHVLQAGAGQITARQAAVNAGIPMSVPATTVNKVCLSGMDAIYQADRRIRAGDAQIVVAGGMESMTNAPHLLPGARGGYRIGDGVIVDSMMYDGLYCAFDQCAMGEGTEKYAQAHGVEREHMDAMALESHRRADAAQANGVFANEMVPVTVPQRKGDALVIAHDEGVRGETTTESLAGLRPAFDKAGHITAGNASQISDGASATIITTAEVAERLGITPLAEILGYGQVAGPTPRCSTSPRGPSRPPSTAPDARWPTSTCSRSTKPSPRSASPPRTTSACPWTSSTSTAAPSPSATPSACRAIASPSTSPSSSPGAAGAPALPRSAVVAVRATPSSSAPSPEVADPGVVRTGAGPSPAHRIGRRAARCSMSPPASRSYPWPC
jgi:acetyl-CoA C-acetyltransferase